MLAPMNTIFSTRPRGFTLIELLVVITLAGILIALAAPSFTGTIARKRVEGVALELGTDFQYARSEAVQRNARVRVIFDVNANCYAVHVVGSTDATSCTNLGTGAVLLKLVQVDSGPTLAFTPAISGTLFVEFDPVRGMALDPSGTVDMSGSVTVSGGGGAWQLRSLVTRVGRMKNCSPNGSVPGFTSDCTT
jgi:type IV fimbrial biogenesis protein FimT